MKRVPIYMYLVINTQFLETVVDLQYLRYTYIHPYCKLVKISRCVISCIFSFHLRLAQCSMLNTYVEDQMAYG